MTQTIVGWLVFAFPLEMADSTALKSFTSATSKTCQPYASNRFLTSSVKLNSVLPSIVMPLSSQNNINLPCRILL